MTQRITMMLADSCTIFLKEDSVLESINLANLSKLTKIKMDMEFCLILEIR